MRARHLLIGLASLVLVLGGGYLAAHFAEREPSPVEQADADLRATADRIAALPGALPIGGQPEPLVRVLGEEQCVRASHWHDFGTTDDFGAVVATLTATFDEIGWTRETQFAPDGTALIIFQRGSATAHMTASLTQLQVASHPTAYSLAYEWRERDCQ